MEKIPVLAVVGPTASGKTSLAIEIAKEYHGEVVSADSMQIYKEMQIATAKPTVDEMQGIPHHLLDFLAPDVSFSVAQYAALAHQTISEITARGHLPVMAGGTGLYVDAVLDDLIFAKSKQTNKNVQSCGRLWKRMARMHCTSGFARLIPRVRRGFTKTMWAELCAQSRYMN